MRAQFQRLRSVAGHAPARASYDVDFADADWAGAQAISASTCAAAASSSSRTWSSTSRDRPSTPIPAWSPAPRSRSAAPAPRRSSSAKGRAIAATPSTCSTSTGLYDQLQDERIRFVDLNQDDVREVPLASRFTGLDTLALPVEVLSADLIVSMPKLKTHHWAGMTASMKNFFGVVPGAVYGWPKNILHVHGIDASILDLNATIRPHLAILDAVTAMEGDGPIMGKPRHVGMVGMSPDLVSLDATAARLIGLEPSRLKYLAEAGQYLGQSPGRSN